MLAASAKGVSWPAGGDKEIPAGRVCTTRDIGNAVVFLASDASSYIRGIDLIVDGGMTRVYAGKN